MHAPEALGRFQHPGRNPAEHHDAAAPTFHVPLDVALPAEEALDGVGRSQRPLESFREPQGDDRSVSSSPSRTLGGGTRVVDVQAAGKVPQAPPGGRDVTARMGAREDRFAPVAFDLRCHVTARMGAREDRLHLRALHVGQALEYVASLVDLTPLHQSRATERLGDRGVQRFRAVDNHQQTAIGPKSTALEIRQQPLPDRRVLGGTLPEPQRLFGARFIETQRHDDAVPADLDPSISSATRSSSSSGVACHASNCACVRATNRRLTALLLVPRVAARRADMAERRP